MVAEKKRIDLNCDMGESFGPYKLGFDEQVIKYITSANVAAGFHAGDPLWMAYTVELAEKHGVGIGSQPSYPDLLGFGRRNMSCSPEEVKNYVKYQTGALTAFVTEGKLQHVKAHGALYNTAVSDPLIAEAIAEAILEIDPDLIMLILAGSQGEKAIKKTGVRIARECFADRALNPDGTLVSRSIPGSVIHNVEEVVERSVRMVTEGTVIAIDGSIIDLEPDTICLHGDTPGAEKIAEAIVKGFNKANVDVRPMSTFIK